jgi:hypothetical protein
MDIFFSRGNQYCGVWGQAYVKTDGREKMEA